MPNTRRPIAQRFWEKVSASSESGCWMWVAYRDKDGYGCLSLPGRRGGSIHAHRFSWMLHNGPIPTGMCVLHKCDNPQCTNPKHLFLGTKRDNWHDMKNKGRWKPGGQPPGEKHSRSKLCENDIREIRRSSLSGPQLARKFNVRKQTIYGIRNRQNWKHI